MMIVGMAFEQEKDTLLANKDYQDLEKKLLTMGGRELVYMPSPSRLIRYIIDYGRLWVDIPVRRVKGKPSQCHDNVELLRKKRQHKYAACHGYALSPDGLWRQHSWLHEGDTIIETTVPRTAYYGVVLNAPNGS
jgi:hypothetical protein